MYFGIIGIWKTCLSVRKCIPKAFSTITLEDVAYAQSAGYVVKLIGRAKRMEGRKNEVMVSPVFVPVENQLSSVDDVFNGVLVKGDETGDVMFYGKGAGKAATASRSDS